MMERGADLVNDQPPADAGRLKAPPLRPRYHDPVLAIDAQGS
jgi:hypothetical protein